ncbi:MAG: hypothetical protein IRZ33_05830 [Alicyclobacillaceae bacterium]|nr:hypothetical protein [Alicyclobacillaceae bacterium]
MAETVVWIGETRVTVHSPSGLNQMTSEERMAWFAERLLNDALVRRVAEIAASILFRANDPER